MFRARLHLRRQSYYVLVSKDASFSNIVDYAFTQLPVYAPRSSSKPTTYPDETTSYYWAVLPAIGMNGSLASGDPLAASPQSFQKQSTPPAQTAPANGASVELQPTFRWTPVEGARRYRVQVADDPTFGSLLDDVLTDSTAYTSNTSYPADTILYWRVRADDENLIGLTWSAVGTFRRRLPAPVLSAANPGSGESIPLWTWAPVNGAVGYDVEVDEPDGDHSQFLDFRSAAFTAVKMTGTGIWGWRVRAVFPKQLGSQTQPGPWSATKPYTRTIAEPGGARTERSGISVLLSWNAKPAAKNYRVQISQRADFQGTVEQVDTDNTSYAPTLLSPTYLAGGTFWWRVAAQDEDRNIGDFSPGQQFSLAKQSGGHGRPDAAEARHEAREGDQRPPRDGDGQGERPRRARRARPGVCSRRDAAQGEDEPVRPRHLQDQEARPRQEAGAPEAPLPRRQDGLPGRTPQHRHPVLAGAGLARPPASPQVALCPGR